MLRPGKTGEAQRKVRRAAEYLKAGDLENAEVWFEEALALDPNSKKALAGLGKVSRLKKIKEHLAEGLALLEQGRLEEADRELRQVISLEPKNADAIAGLRQITQLQKPAERPPEEKALESSARVSEHQGVQGEQSIEKTGSLIEYMRHSRRRSRKSNVSFLLVSGIVHLALFIVLSLFIVDISHKPEEYISIEWVNVADPKSPVPKPLRLATEKKFSTDPRTAGERSVKSLADRVTKTNTQTPRQDPTTIKLGPKAGERTLPQMFSAVDVTESDSDLAFSPRETMAMGSGLNKPGVSSRPGASRPGRGLGGLSTIQSSAAAVDGFSGISLGGLVGQGLVGPDPMDMVSAVTFDRKPQETVVFLLDISNSMEGNYQRGVYNREWSKKLRRAKHSIISSLYNLREDKDKFYLVAFSSDFRLFNEKPVTVDKSSLAEAIKFVEELRPTTHRERTDLYSALVSALEVKPTRIIVVSDGLPTEGVVSVKNILNGVKQNNKNGARIYTFATNLGNRPEARVLLSRMAKDNGGNFRNDKMGLPRGIAVNSAGDIYVADVTVKVFDSNTKYIRSFGSHTIKLATGPSDDIHLLFFPSASLSGFGALGVCRSDGTQLKSFSSHGYLPRQVYDPWDVAADSKGNTYVVSTRANRISIFDKDGNFVRSFGSAGMRAYETGPSERGDSLRGGSRRTGIDRRGVSSSEKGYFSRPMGIALDSYDNIYVLDSGNRRVQIFNPQLQYRNEFRIDGYGISIAVDSEGKYIHVLIGSGSTGGEEVYIYRPNGAVVGKFDTGSGTADIDLDSAGNIYTLSFVYDEVNIFSREGDKLRSFSTIQ